MLGFILVIQTITGVFLTIHYSPDIKIAFDSINYIMHRVNGG
jgi:ubiquinol-cytochrome c reductase cytochrome b subunit